MWTAMQQYISDKGVEEAGLPTYEPCGQQCNNISGKGVEEAGLPPYELVLPLQ
jgi:hypothetical protein